MKLWNKDFWLKTYAGILGYAAAIPTCLIGLFYLSIAASMLLLDNPLKSLLYADGSVPFSVWIIGISYLALLVAALFWIRSNHFAKCPNWLFFSIAASVFLLFCILTLCFLDGAPFYDCSGFHAQALRMAKRCNWRQIKETLYPENLYVTRGFWCWYLPYKLFGESVATISCVNLTAWGVVCGTLYAILRLGQHRRDVARATLLLCILCPIGYFIAPAPMACNIGLAYAGCTIFMLILILRYEKKLRKNPPPKKIWLFNYLIPLLLAILFGAFLMLTEGSRNLGTHLKFAIFVFLLLAGLYYAPNIRETWRSALRIIATVAVALCVAPLVKRCVFHSGIKPVIIQKEAGKVAGGINWLFTINGKELQIGYPTSGGLTNAIYRKLPPEEFRRELINNRFLDPITNGSVNYTLYQEKIFRLRSLANCYSNITSFIKCAPHQDPADFKFYYDNVYQLLRKSYLLLLGILGFLGSWSFAKRGRVTDPVFTFFFFSFCVITGCMTIAEAGPKIGFLSIPTMILAGGFACRPGTFSVADDRSQKERKFLLPVFALCMLASIILMPFAVKLAYRDFHPIDLTAMKFTPETIGPYKAALKRWKMIDNRTALLLPDGVEAGSGTQTITDLVPGGKYRFLGYCRSTLPKGAKGKDNPYLLTISCNATPIYVFDSQKDAGLYQYPTRELFEKKATKKVFHLIWQEVSADANGEIELKIDARKANVKEPLYLMMMDVELIPQEK